MTSVLSLWLFYPQKIEDLREGKGGKERKSGKKEKKRKEEIKTKKEERKDEK